MSDKQKFWFLLGLLVLSVAWVVIARHVGSDHLLEQF